MHGTVFKKVSNYIMKNTDQKIIEVVLKGIDDFNYFAHTEGTFPADLEYPLDSGVIDSLKGLKSKDEGEYAIFKEVDKIMSLWKTLIKKSIICLRYFDSREPFLSNPNKKPQAYGVEKLDEYFEKYASFEELLYGGSKYYRDHLVHSFRVWLLGVEQLIKDKCKYLKEIKVTEGNNERALEKISIWTIIALTHDLGYPLEKAIEIVDKTKDMMKSFVVDPVVSMDLSFTGVQNSMNDYVLRFISSKMLKSSEISGASVKDEGETEDKAIKKEYVARLQPKYYFKFQKSLEQKDHGIISALIIYKLLIYFLESDYSVNEDYYFGEEDRRQFYIRREILRAIASHTCRDIYQQNAFNFSFLLILCDDAQEWGRKYLSELYVNKGEEYEYRGIELITNTEKIDGKDKELLECKFSDKYVLEEKTSIEYVLSRFDRQSKTYRDIFRDGQDTMNRNFNFIRQLKIDINNSPKVEYTVTLSVSVNERTNISVKCEDDKPVKTNEDFYNAFEKVFKGATLSDDSKTLNYLL